MNEWFKRNGIHLAMVAFFAAICFFYFTPAFSGKYLAQNDIRLAQQTQREIMEYKAKEGKAPLWTNAMFAGMPAYQIWAQYPNNITTHIIAIAAYMLPNPANIVLLYLLGAYLLFCVLKLNPWLAATGAVAFAFSSYNFIYIEAGHGTQAMAIAFFAPIVAGVLLVFRGKYLLGGFITAFFLALEIRANHVQMTYYLLLVLLILALIEAYHAFKNKQLPIFGKAVGTLAVAGVLALGVNTANLWTTYEYAEESIRGKSNLTKNTEEPQTGVSKEYAYQWSQGVGEMMTVLIPDAYGGSSDGRLLDEKSEVVKVIAGKGVPADQALGFAQQALPTYWGEKQFTSGPWYFGAIVVFFFVLGLLIVKNRLKWWLAGAVLLTVLLSFGKNFSLVSDLFFDYFPMYNKFRAVESILAVTALCVPILALLAIKELQENSDKNSLWKMAKISAGITGGLCLIVAVYPDILSLRPADNAQTMQILNQAFQGNTQAANEVVSALIRDRASIARADAFRSLIFILLGLAIVWAMLKNKLKIQYAYIALTALILVDMWGVDKRYLRDANFGPKQDVAQPKTDVDDFILRDKDLGYRVLDFSNGGNPFVNAATSYYHRSLGGYHAAKLKRYQELIEKNFTNSINQDVLDMLNTRYIIQQDPKDGSVKMQRNATACGPAWFVKNVRFVKNSDEEMEAISSFDPKNDAIVDQKFKSMLDPDKKAVDPNASIKLVDYHPDHLTYEYSSSTPQTTIFSEIYYDKGWNMYVDGDEKPYFRADYLLRAAEIPLGNHKIEFKFEPKSYYTGEKISLAASILLVLGGIGVLVLEIKKRRKA